MSLYTKPFDDGTVAILRTGWAEHDDIVGGPFESEEDARAFLAWVDSSHFERMGDEKRRDEQREWDRIRNWPLCPTPGHEEPTRMHPEASVCEDCLCDLQREEDQREAQALVERSHGLMAARKASRADLDKLNGVAR
jgi:hypothetical protein